MCGIVHDEKEFSTDWGHWFKEGSYPGIDNGIRMLLDAETFDSGPGDASAEVNFLTGFHIMGCRQILIKLLFGCHAAL